MDRLISVIVTTYNQEDTIARTLDSVLAQRCSWPIEIMIGEDYSTDGTREICRRYAKEHPDSINLIENERNKGLTANYFDCILQSRGKYIADCAGDDFWTDPLKLEKELTVLEEHPDVTLVHTDWLYYDEEHHTTRQHVARLHDKPLTEGTELLVPILTQRAMPIIHLCTALYRRDAFLKAYNADERLFRLNDFGCEDVPVCFMLARQGRIAYLPDVTLSYSVSDGTISNNSDDSKQYAFVECTTALTHYIATAYNIDHHDICAYLQQKTYEMAMHAFRAFSPALRQETKKAATEWGVKPSLRYCLVMLITAHKATWQAALALRKAIKELRGMS